MSQYLLRMDDASDYMDAEKWQRMEELLDRYGIKPLVGVIPDNRDLSRFIPDFNDLKIALSQKRCFKWFTDSLNKERK